MRALQASWLMALSKLVVCFLVTVAGTFREWCYFKRAGKPLRFTRVHYQIHHNYGPRRRVGAKCEQCFTSYQVLVCPKYIRQLPISINTWRSSCRRAYKPYRRGALEVDIEGRVLLRCVERNQIRRGRHGLPAYHRKTVTTRVTFSI